MLLILLLNPAWGARLSVAGRSLCFAVGQVPQASGFEVRWLRSQAPESCHQAAPSFLGCRNLWARVVSSTCAKVKNHPSVTDNWIELFILSQCVLRFPPLGGCKHLRYEEKYVQSRLNRWLNGEATQLRFDATSSVKPLVIKPFPFGEIDFKRARKLGHEGSYLKAIESLCFDDAALSVLQEKHPPAVTAVQFPEHPPDLVPCSISRDILINCVDSFPKDSAAGVSQI